MNEQTLCKTPEVEKVCHDFHGGKRKNSLHLSFSQNFVSNLVAAFEGRLYFLHFADEETEVYQG